MLTLPDDALRQLADRKRLLAIEWHKDIGSTSTEARRFIEAGHAALQLPYVIVADQQSAGRGQGSNRWWASEDGLTFTWIGDPAAYRIPPPLWPALSLVAGLAVVEVCSAYVGTSLLGLNWPNDVYLDRRKLAGILTEMIPTPTGEPRLVIGIGLNVNDPMTSVPEEVRRRATSLLATTGQRLDRGALLAALLNRLAERLADFGHDPRGVGERFDAVSLDRGRAITVDLPNETLSGHCLGIATDGALLVQTTDDVRRVVSGRVRRGG
jgi:BirA family biotin operon repressor/biotin-[acetyl-CoA-carboxylase] ligase